MADPVDAISYIAGEVHRQAMAAKSSGSIEPAAMSVLLNALRVLRLAHAYALHTDSFLKREIGSGEYIQRVGEDIDAIENKYRPGRLHGTDPVAYRVEDTLNGGVYYTNYEPPFSPPRDQRLLVTELIPNPAVPPTFYGSTSRILEEDPNGRAERKQAKGVQTGSKEGRRTGG